jgi:thiamine biosynthesis protein ThiS
MLKMIEIFVNGERVQAPVDASVSGLLKLLKIAPDRVAVELNKTLIRKRDWDATPIPSGAYLEVVEFVGGG